MILKKDIFRTIFHFLLLIIPIFYYEFGKSQTLEILIPLGLTIIIIDLLRQKFAKINQIFNKIFGIFLKEKEVTAQTLSSISYIFIGILATIIIFNELIAISAILVLIICDYISAIIGKIIKSPQFFEKTIASAIGFFTSGFIVIYFIGFIYQTGFWFYLFSPLALAAATIIESRPSLFKIDDNLSIPIIFSIFLTIFDLIWNYNF
jgi:dolichol kinase